MNKLLEAITKNPLFVFIGWLGTMIALLLAIVVPIIQTKRVLLNVSYTSNILVTDSLSEMEGLDINFRGSKIGQLTVTTCEISNTGNVTIEDSDVYEGHKLRVFTENEKADVLLASVVSQSYDTNNCQVYYDEKSVNIYFDVLEKKEKCVINIYHTGDADTEFSADGKIKEGRIREGEIIDKERIKPVFYGSILILTIFFNYLFEYLKRFAKEPSDKQNVRFFQLVNYSLTMILMIVLANLLIRSLS